MTNADYRLIPAYSHSDLSELFRLRTGTAHKTIDPKAARFGTAFHSLILEPESFSKEGLHVTEVDKLYQMRDSFRQNASSLTVDNVHYAEIESVFQSNCPTTLLPLKCRIDALYNYDMTDIRWAGIIDLKTTSCATASEFFDAFIKYGYDRQAAFYLDMAGLGYNFTFVGVRKVKPFTVFEIDMSGSFDRKRMIDNARQKNARLLRDAYAESLKPDGWRPTSWSRKEEL